MSRSRRQLHISWHIAWAAGGVLGGTALVLVVPPALFASAAWPITACGLFFFAVRRRTASAVLLAVVAGGLLGLWRGSMVQVSLQSYRPYYGRHVELRGALADDAAFGSRGEQRLSLRDVRIGDTALPGKVWVSTPAAAKRGDIVTMHGILSEGFGTWPATMHRAGMTHLTQPRPGDVARRLRDWFGEGVRRAIPEPGASLGMGYLTGQHNALPETLQQQLRTVGLTHAVVASGYNLTILVGGARRLAARWSKYAAMAAGGVLISGFILVTGLSPSMSRAGLVTGFSLFAWYYGRSIHPLVLLPFAAACTAFVQPAYVWGDLGWYLSFTAFAGVIVLAPLLQRYFWGTAPPGILRQVIVDTFAAQLATGPIILAAFGQYSLYALPANVLIVPFIPLAMLCTFVAGVAGTLVPTMAPLVGWPATFVLDYSIHVVAWFARAPGAQGEVSFYPAALVIGYILLILVGLWMRHTTGLQLKEQSILREKVDKPGQPSGL